MDRRTLLLGAGVAFVGGGAYALLRPSFSGGLPLVPQAAQAQTAAVSAEAPVVLEMVKGREDAPVEVIEYASFTCPHCRTFHENVLPQLIADYIDTGQVRFIYREVYFDRFGLWAGLVARCAGPERYFNVVDLIYAQQAEWTQGSPAEIAENLRRIGRTIGLSDAQLDTCMTDAAMAQAMLETYEANAAEHNVRGTPAFVVDGQTYSNMSYADFSAILDERIAAAE
jgi:protein-disulfide isomerase